MGFQLLSKAKPKKAGKGVCITTSMEAFATTVLKGCHKPWQDWYAEEHKPKNLGKSFEYLDFDKYNATQGKDPKDTPHKKYMDTKKYFNKYTKLDLGQVCHGGWTNKGLEAYARHQLLAIQGQNCQL
jgi:hypothetical protein